MPGLLALVGAVGPLLYVLLVTVLGLLWEGYDPVRDSMSELGSVESPYGPLMNVAGFMALGLSILAFAAAYQLLLPRGPWKAVAAGLLVVAGVFMVVVGFFPCDAGCVDVTRTGTLHSITSTPQAIALPLAAMASAFVFGSDRRFGTAWQAFSGWAGLVSLGTGPLVAAGSLAAVTGLVQRAGIGLSLLWMTALKRAVGARDHRVFFGAWDRRNLGRGRLGFAERIVARRFLPEGDWRDWPEIEAWASDIARALTAPRAVPR